MKGFPITLWRQLEMMQIALNKLVCVHLYFIRLLKEFWMGFVFQRQCIDDFVATSLCQLEGIGNYDASPLAPLEYPTHTQFARSFL